MHLWSENQVNLGTFSEEVTISQLPLPISDSVDSTQVVLKKISGEIPPGIKIDETNLVGTPMQVIKSTDYKFVIRAQIGVLFQDNTFTMTIVGPDSPVWTTNAGSLPVGNNDLTFILDNSVVNYQLFATDDDLPAGDVLEYYIKSNNGELPPGLKLSTDGKIQGIIDPLLALDAAAASDGDFDITTFDSQPYDYSVQLSTQGFDSFFYDIDQYDSSRRDKAPKKLNRTYEFIVTVTDGDVEVNRVFKIFVVGDDFLKADNTLMTAGSGTFTADGTSFRNIIWLTPDKLGVRRANNYMTIFLETLDPANSNGLITYELLPLNGDNTKSELPPGLQLDGLTGELAGRTPYQAAISEDYKFTVRATRFKANSSLENVTFTIFEDVYPAIRSNVGEHFIKINKLNDVDLEQSLIGTIWRFPFNNTLTILSINTLNENYDEIRIKERVIFADPQAIVPYDPLTEVNPAETIPVIRKNQEYTQVINTGIEVDTISNSKTFSIKFLGDVDSEIVWNTDSDLGIIRSNIISNLEISATSSVPNANVAYNLVSGSLPPGLAINQLGQIIGKASQFATDTRNGLIFFDSNSTTFDAGTTSFDRKFTFTVSARDKYGYDVTTRTFTLQVNDPSEALYSNLYFRPMLRSTQRNKLNTFFKDSNIFNPNLIYRLDDNNFGVVKKLEMLVYAGIETKQVSSYVPAMAKNKRRQRMQFGNLKKAIATDANDNIVYEVVYLEVRDPNEPTTGTVMDQFYINVNEKLSADMVKLETIDDESNVGEGITSLVIDGRNFDPVYTIDDIVLEIFTRTGSLLVPIDDFSLDVRNDPEDVEINLNYSSPETRRQRPEGDTITVDSNLVTINRGNDQVRYVSNTQKMRDAISNVGSTEREFLPKWMRTAQEGSLQELGYIKAVPLCYCKPGTGQQVLNNIEASSFDFKNIDFEVDRYVIDSTVGNSNEQYLKFPDYKLNV
jgi:hypothetical protein